MSSLDGREIVTGLAVPVSVRTYTVEGRGQGSTEGLPAAGGFGLDAGSEQRRIVAPGRDEFVVAHNL